MKLLILIILNIAIISLNPFALAVAGERPLRVGIYTGTFDPPHLGHADVIKSAIADGHLDVIYVIPNVLTAHKPNATPYKDRRAMAILAFKDIPRVRVADPEFETIFGQDGNQISMLQAVRSRHPSAFITRISGADNAKGIPLEKLATLPIDQNDIYDRPADEGKTNTKISDPRIFWHDTIGNHSGFSSSQIRNGSLKNRDRAVTPEVSKFMTEHMMYSCGDAFAN